MSELARLISLTKMQEAKIEMQDAEIRKLKGIMWALSHTYDQYAAKVMVKAAGPLAIRETESMYVLEALPRLEFDGEIED